MYVPENGEYPQQSFPPNKWADPIYVPDPPLSRCRACEEPVGPSGRRRPMGANMITFCGQCGQAHDVASAPPPEVRGLPWRA